MRRRRGPGLFCGFAAAVLVCTGLGKVAAFLNPVPQYGGADPIFRFLTMGQVLFLGGIVELVLAACVLLVRSQERRAALVTWFGATVLLYRAGFRLLGVAMPCHCLGYFARWSPFSPSATDSLMLTLAVVLFAGGLVLLAGSLLRGGVFARIATTPPRRGARTCPGSSTAPPGAGDETARHLD